jgi:hypothetical protein
VSLASFLLVLAQAAATPPATAEECRGTDGEIVVCGSRKANERYRLRPLPEPAEKQPPQAKIKLDEGTELAAGIDPGTIPGAENVPRFMIKFKMKF